MRCISNTPKRQQVRQCDATMAKTANKLPPPALLLLLLLPVATCHKLPVCQLRAVAVASWLPFGNPICPYAARCLYKVMRPIFDIFWRSAHALGRRQLPPPREAQLIIPAPCSFHRAMTGSMSVYLRSCADMPALGGSSS